MCCIKTTAKTLARYAKAIDGKFHVRLSAV
jgi:hypothetical protein